MIRSETGVACTVPRVERLDVFFSVDVKGDIALIHVIAEGDEVVDGGVRHDLLLSFIKGLKLLFEWSFGSFGDSILEFVGGSKIPTFSRSIHSMKALAMEANCLQSSSFLTSLASSASRPLCLSSISCFKRFQRSVTAGVRD